MSKTNNSSSGIGAISALGIVFIVLKLTGHIDWSWWYVTLPFWGGIVLFLIIGGIVLLTVFIISVIKAKRKHR